MCFQRYLFNVYDMIFRLDMKYKVVCLFLVGQDNMKMKEVYMKGEGVSK